MSEDDKTKDGLVPALYGKFEVDTPEGNIIEYHILDHEIRELYSLAIIGKQSFICSYFPAQVIEIKGTKEKPIKIKTWKNVGFFVTYDDAKPLGIKKNILPITNEWLRENFKINVLPNWNKVRWSYESYFKWYLQKEPTNPKDLLEKLKTTIIRYLDLDSDSTYSVLALWIIGTYFHRLFDAYPYLDFTGAKRAGKTKTLELIKHTAFNPTMSPDFTGSSMFRTIEQTSGTILLDEAENFKNQKSESAQHVRTLIMQGFMNDQFVPRTNKDSMNVEFYSLYSPKALGHINGFDDVLDERCIKIVMKRSAKKEILNTWPNQDDPVFAEIRHLAYTVFLEYAKDMVVWKNTAAEYMNVFGREKLLFQPIITLAVFFESFGVQGLREGIIKFASESHTERQIIDEEQNTATKIAKYLIDNLPVNAWIVTRELFADMRAKAEDYQINIEWLTMRKFTEILRTLGIKDKRTKNGVSWLMNKEDADRIKTTHLDIEPASDLASFDSFSTSSTPQEQNLVPKGELNEPSVVNEPEGEVGQTTPKMNEVKQVNEQQNMSSTSSSSSTPILDIANVDQKVKNVKRFRCETCKAGPFGVNEESKSVGNILEWHRKQGHTILYLKEKKE